MFKTGNISFPAANLVMSESVCINCGDAFIKKRASHGYNRYSVKSLTSPRTFGQVFKACALKTSSPRTFFKSNSEYFLCPKCVKELVSQTVTTPVKKRKRTLADRESPCHTSFTPQSKSTKKEWTSVVGMTARDRAVAYMMDYKYKLAFAILIQDSEAAKQALLSVHADLVKSEVSLYLC